MGKEEEVEGKGKKEMKEEEKVEEEEEQANKKIVKEAVALVQHARSNPSIIYRQLFCFSPVYFICGQHNLHQICFPSILHYGSSTFDNCPFTPIFPGTNCFQTRFLC